MTSETRNTITLLRFPFSLFLLPITLFSLYFIRPPLDYRILLLILIWHGLVYPASNGYNSYHDRDETPIGGLEAPPQPTRQLWKVCNILDASGLILAVCLNIYFSLFVAVYIFGSRLYSNRKTRIKRLPVTSFVLVFIFQGAWIFCANIIAFSKTELLVQPSVLFSVAACSCIIGTIYPLTQIYQHDADRKDGVTTMSMLLGIRGTFIFTALLFGAANLFIFLSFKSAGTINYFWLFNIVMSPATIFFVVWAILSFKDTRHVNFKNAMRMLILSSFLNNLYFCLLFLL